MGIPPNVKNQSEAKKIKYHIVVVQNVGMCKAYPTFGKTSSIFHIFIERFLYFFKIDIFGTKFKLLFGCKCSKRSHTCPHRWFNHDAGMITDIPSLQWTLQSSSSWKCEDVKIIYIHYISFFLGFGWPICSAADQCG